MENIDMELFRERLKDICKKRKVTHKDLAKKTGTPLDTVNAWFRTSETLPPSLNKMYRISKVLEVSIDYFVNPDMDCLTVSNQMINSRIGLNDQGIKGLENIKLSDDNAALNGQPGLCVLPVLNDMLSVYNGSGFEKVLQGVRDFMNTDYCVPVYHTDKGVVIKTEKGNTATIETIKSSSPLDTIGGKTQTYIDKKGKKTKFVQETIHIQHFAKENDNYDNKAVAITKEFLAAVALKEIEQGLIELKKDMGK